MSKGEKETVMSVATIVVVKTLSRRGKKLVSLKIGSELIKLPLLLEESSIACLFVSNLLPILTTHGRLVFIYATSDFNWMGV
jgi:hypothetical protein